MESRNWEEAGCYGGIGEKQGVMAGLGRSRVLWRNS